MSEQPVKQKIVDKLKDSETVLVTVNSSPSVDELSAALGFTLLLNKMNKHATAVFSGDVPPAITFLDPEKTFESTVDSLRDFIIALDKERADHLRYKVEGDMVKIFITPYRTTIDKDDFEFSQGDYNVEMVVAIGVQSEDDLDRALSEHGRILHDATVASLSLGDNKSQLGTIHWHDGGASSYSEMLVGVAEALKGSKNLIDEQIATAFLTGIVAATERFSNTKTSSDAMTMAATLMAAGANQQLIATRLEEANLEDEELDKPTDSSPDEEKPDDSGGSDSASMLKVKRDEATPKKKTTSKSKKQPAKDKPAADGSMAISHEKQGTIDEVAEQVVKEEQKAAAEHAEAQLASSLGGVTKKGTAPSVADLKNDLERASEEVDRATEVANDQTPAPMAESVLPAPVAEPSPAIAPVADTSGPHIGGTLNATTEQAAEDKRRELAGDRNKTLLSHDTGGYLETERQDNTVTNPHNQAVSMTAENSQPSEERQVSHEGSQRGKTIMPLTAQPAPVDSAGSPTLADIDAKNRGQTAAARSDIEQALQQSPSASGALPPLPPMPDFSTLPELPPAQSADMGDFIQTPLPQSQPPFSQPAQSQAQLAPVPQSDQAPFPNNAQPVTNQPQDPSQFQPPVSAGVQAQKEQNLAERLSDILPPAQPQSVARPQPSQDPSQFQLPN